MLTHIKEFGVSLVIIRCIMRKINIHVYYCNGIHFLINHKKPVSFADLMAHTNIFNQTALVRCKDYSFLHNGFQETWLMVRKSSTEDPEHRTLIKKIILHN